uniref:14-3-3 domain-containing protein n=1 Tax=Ditylenchus dipsaci TaxID=166011 RepID=A0A915E927_9BILA
MQQALERDELVSIKEGNLYLTAYSHVVETRHRSWNVIVKKQNSPDNPDQHQWDICNDVLKTMEKVVPRAVDDDGKVFFLKIKADHLRFLAEMVKGVGREDVVKKTRQAYAEAFYIAQKKMLPTDNVRLGLAYNFSVFYREIALVKDEAYNLAKKALNDALAEMNGVDEDSLKDIAMIMQQLRDNLKIWEVEDGIAPQDGRFWFSSAFIELSRQCTIYLDTQTEADYSGSGDSEDYDEGGH